jgi:hypothetical protein
MCVLFVRHEPVAWLHCHLQYRGTLANGWDVSPSGRLAYTERRYAYYQKDVLLCMHLEGHVRTDASFPSRCLLNRNCA